jgi:hypothetical protein
MHAECTHENLGYVLGLLHAVLAATLSSKSHTHELQHGHIT